MNDGALVAAILAAGALIRMPGASAASGDPEADRAARATEAVECYCAVLKAVRLAIRAGEPGITARRSR